MYTIDFDYDREKKTLIYTANMYWIICKSESKKLLK